MPDLSSASPDELRAELARRDVAAQIPMPQPKASDLVDWAAVYKTVVDGVRDAIERQFMDDDTQGYVWEAAVEAIYGKDYWTWRRAQRW